MVTKPKTVEEVDFQGILNRNQELLESIAPDVYRNLTTIDPANKLMGISAYIEGLVRNKVNNALLAVMVDFAKNEDLDNLGKFYGLTRKILVPANNSTVPPEDPVYETDKEFRTRIKEAPFGFSVAGPSASYEFYGKQADVNVKDISAISPSPCVVNITVLSYQGNGSADDALVKTVNKALNSKHVRPVADLVEVQGAEIIEYTIDVKISLQENIPEYAINLNEIIFKLQNYADSEHRCGGMVVQSGIYAASHIKGVEQVIIENPTEDIICTPAQAPYCTSITAEFMPNNKILAQMKLATTQYAVQHADTITNKISQLKPTDEVNPPETPTTNDENTLEEDTVDKNSVEENEIDDTSVDNNSVNANTNDENVDNNEAVATPTTNTVNSEETKVASNIYNFNEQDEWN